MIILVLHCLPNIFFTNLTGWMPRLITGMVRRPLLGWYQNSKLFATLKRRLFLNGDAVRPGSRGTFPVFFRRRPSTRATITAQQLNGAAKIFTALISG